MLKIFHTGDNHLDSRFASLSPSEREAQRERQRSLFVRMVDHARQNEYGLMLISGDLFDSPEVSPETADAVWHALADFGGPVVISPGNHDPYRQTSFYSNSLPENVYVFNSTELQAFDIEELGVRVWGYAFTDDTVERSPLTDCDIPEFCGIQLICAHADLGVQGSKYAPVSEKELAKKGIVYAALGHIHKLSAPYFVGKTLISYCGFPEGRAFDEEGHGGAVSVVIDRDTASAERIVFAERAYFREELDISDSASDEELISRIRAHIADKGYGTQTALRLCLIGAREASYKPNTELCLTAVSPMLLKFELTDSSFPSFDAKQLEGDYTLRGEVYRALLPKLNSEDEHERRIASEALAVALMAIEGRRII